MKAILLSGIPYSGKSVYTNNNFPLTTVVSSYLEIEKYCSRTDQHYNDVFHDYYNIAELAMMNEFQYCVDNRLDFIIDRTNLSVKSRQKWIDKIPNCYDIECHYWTPDIELSISRKSGRPEKVISDKLLYSMSGNFIEPSIEEGFSLITRIN